MVETLLFTNRVGVLATMHRKEQVIAPLLAQSLGIQVTVPEHFNTDRFGTFTRDIERTGDQIATARLKAQAALNYTGATLAIASEGSFAPHPLLPYLARNRELVLLIDQEHELAVIGEALSTNTNFSHRRVASFAEAQAFAASVGFPEHGLVVMVEADTRDSDTIIKGITTDAALQAAVEHLLSRSPDGKVHLETDMRALYNPRRMQVIAAATQDLIAKLNSRCPTCSHPNFAITEHKRGLPCRLCRCPTELTRSVVYGCQKCSFTQEVLFPEGIETADPAQCPYCNP
jgi:DNA-directed RNA polymerase subunit RPC12/RpoP